MATIETANAKGNAGIALGSTAVGIEILNALAGGNGLAGILGNLTGNKNTCGDPMAVLAAMAAMNAAVPHGGCCNEDHTVNRYELGLQQENEAKNAEIALLRANIYNDQKDLEQQRYMDGRFMDFERRLGEQAVINQRTADSFERAHDDLMCVKTNLEGQIAAERAARCCSDNTIISYVNGTFYPKLVAGVTPTTDTTAQALYNPIGNCGGGCGCGNN